MLPAIGREREDGSGGGLSTARPGKMKIKSVHNVLNDFANSTSLNGIPRIINARSMTGRVSWAAVCLAAFVMFVWTSSNLVANYFAYPKKVNVEIVQRPVTFPSVTVCNTDHLDLLVVEQLEQLFTENSTEEGERSDEEADRHRDRQTNSSIDRFLKRYADFADYSTYYLLQQHMVVDEGSGQGKYNLDMDLLEVTSRLGLAANVGPELSSEVGIRAEDFIITCRFMGESCKIKDTFVKVFDPYYFNCFTFKTQVILESRSTRLSGVEYGLSLLLFSGTAGHLSAGAVDGIVPGMQSADPALASGQGARVVIHSPDTVPHPTFDGFDVPSGFSVTIGVRARENVRIPHPYGNCTRVETNSEYQYSLISCQNQCIQAAIERSCHCIDNRIPSPESGRRQRDGLPFCLQFPDSFNRCSMAHGAGAEPAAAASEGDHDECQRAVDQFRRRLDCRKQVYETMTLRNPDAMDQCRCYPPCLDVVYDASYSLSMLPEGNKEHAAFYARVDEFLADLNPRRRRRLPSRDSPAAAPAAAAAANESRHLDAVKRLVSRLNVHIADNNVLKATESPDYDLIRLVSDIGGQLGLWIGISVITLMEVMQLCADVVSAVASCYGRVCAVSGARGAAVASDCERERSGGDLRQRRQGERERERERMGAAPTSGFNHNERRIATLDNSNYVENYFGCEVDKMTTV